MNKLFVGILAFVALSAVAKETFEIEYDCNDIFSCTSETGTFKEGTARAGHRKYIAKDAGAKSTCCQLASTIQNKICKDKNDSKGVVVTCE